MVLMAPLALVIGAGQPGAANSPSNAASAPSNSTGTTASAATPQQGGGMRSVRDSAGRIVSQPAKDVGAARTNIPPALTAAAGDPYNMKGLGSCKAIAKAFHSMTDVLGPDFKVGDVKKENKAGKLAEAGGQTVVNSLIPFRGLVREVTGAAPAQRRLNRAIDAGYARRGFLRGLYTARKCKSPVLF